MLVLFLIRQNVFGVWRDQTKSTQTVSLPNYTLIFHSEHGHLSNTVPLNCINDFECSPFDRAAPTLQTPQSAIPALDKLIADLEYKWEMIFNPDLSKQAQKVIFSRKTNKISHPTTNFTTIPVACTSCQKHLGLYLDEKLKFSQHINIKLQKQTIELESLKGFHIFSKKVHYNYLQIFH